MFERMLDEADFAVTLPESNGHRVMSLDLTGVGSRFPLYPHAEAGSYAKGYEPHGIREPAARSFDPAQSLALLKVRLRRRGLTAQEIGMLRRDFALAYHPDRCPEDLRMNGGECIMAIANQLLDEALCKTQRQRQ